MRLKHLQSALSSVPVNQFPTPNVTLEQYATSPTLTSHVIHAAYSNDDIGPGLSVCDLGCGTGMLSIGCALVGSTCVLCVDCDSNALSIARDNIMDMELEATVDDDGSIDEEGCRFEFILSKVKHVPDIRSNQQSNRRDGKRRGGNKRSKATGGRGHRTIGNSHEVSEMNDQNHKMKMTMNGDDGIPLRSKCVDTVMTNPPFGTKPGNAGIDVTFLRTATRLAKRAVYSFHKTSTRQYLIKTIKAWGYDVTVVAEMKFEIGKMYKFHTKDSVDVEVDLIRIAVDSGHT